MRQLTSVPPSRADPRVSLRNSEEDLDHIKSFLTKFKTRPGKRRAVPEDEDLENVDMDDDGLNGEDAAPREKYVEMLVRRT